MLPRSAELLANASEVSGSASVTGKNINVLLSMAEMGEWRGGGCGCGKWKNANKYRTDADKFQLPRKLLGAVERAADLEPDRPGLKSQMRLFQSQG